MKLATRFRSVINFGLALVLIITVIGCQPTTSSRSTSSRMPSLTPRPTVTSVRPTLTALPITVAVAPTVPPTGTVAPEVPGVGYPPDARTGIAHLDAIIDAVLANDLARVRELTHFAQVGCTTAEGFGGPPKCRKGEAPGTLVKAVPTLGPEGMALRDDDPSAGISAGDYRLVTAMRNVTESIRSEEWWLPVKYALVFGNADAPSAVILLVDDEGIVRFVHVESMDRVWQLVSGGSILPPAQSTTPVKQP